MPLAPDVQQFLQQLMSLSLPPIHAMTPDHARRSMSGLASMLPPQPFSGRIADRRIAVSAPGPSREIPVRTYAPAGSVLAGGTDVLPALVYFHGGGFVIGDLESIDALCRAIADTARCLVVSVDYRLAPEHRFPAGVEDCCAATAWVWEHAAELGADPACIAVGGDSAGGNLAAVTAQWARDRGGPPLCLQLLLYPATDMDGSYPSQQDPAMDGILHHRDLPWFLNHYVAEGTARSDPRLSPLRAQSLQGLPPAIVVTCELDPLRDEGEAFAEKLRAAGVPVTSWCADGQFHGFYQLSPLLPSARAAQDRTLAALRTALYPQPA